MQQLNLNQVYVCRLSFEDVAFRHEFLRLGRPDAGLDLEPQFGSNHQPLKILFKIVKCSRARLGPASKVGPGMVWCLRSCLLESNTRNAGQVSGFYTPVPLAPIFSMTFVPMLKEVG